MNNIIKLLLLVLLSITFLFSQDEIKSKELYLTYEKYPDRVFTGQKFEVKLQAIILTNEEKYDEVITTFTQEENIGVLTQDIIWKKDTSGKYFTTISYKTYHKKFILPTITIALVKDDNIIDFISAKSPKIKYEKIAINEKTFSGIIATSLEVHTVKTKQYTNNILHSTIKIEATNSNLEDIKLKQYTEQGIKNLTQKGLKQEVYYYVMIPSHTKQISFTYYNVNLKEFIMINIPIIMDEELVSTQTELNPYNSSLLVYKQVFSSALLLFFIFIYLISKRDIYLILITIFIVILAYLFIPNKKILLVKDIKVYILPTKSSTIYEILKSKRVVEIINEKDNFIKVLFKNKNIGWINKNDIK
ncbi:MAG: hypothetical protein DRG78_19785 [Epsilonproteobacteria bacterium]|nr:MAG: hypothetical protein DRG78_19785 [Campylobacterota bacterium]